MSVSIDKGYAKAQAFLAAIPRAAEKATASALNQAAAAARESAISEIGDRYAVRAGDVREKIGLITASENRLTVSVVATSSSLALGYFPHTPTAPGTGGPRRPPLRAEVLRGQSKDVGGAFVVHVGGKDQIMVRTGGRTSTGKTKIKRVLTVPMAVMLGVESVRSEVEKRALATFDERLDREIDRALGKAA